MVLSILQALQMHSDGAGSGTRTLEPLFGSWICFFDHEILEIPKCTIATRWFTTMNTVFVLHNPRYLVPQDDRAHPRAAISTISPNNISICLRAMSEPH